MKKWIIVALIAVTTQPCFALLSPLNQSLEEIQSIVQSNELQKYLPQNQQVIEIQHQGNAYLLKTNALQLLVEVQYIPIERPGKQQYKLFFHEPVPIEQQKQ